jgi:hypothetical protein
MQPGMQQSSEWGFKLSARSPRQFVVSQSFNITGRGAGVLFEDDPAAILPLGPVRVQVSTPAGHTFEVDANIEAARKVPPGEVLALHFPSLSSSELPVGSVVVLVDA